MKVLALDIETSPNLAHVWGLWQQNVSLSQLLESTEMICWGARWLDKKPVMFASVHHDGKDAMLKGIHDLLNEADVVVHWNGKSFDMKHLNREFYEAGMLPPSPVQQVDLMLAVKRQFRFPSNKLQYVSTRSGLPGKVQHSGHSLWVRCMAGDDKAWALMRRYQRQDVNLLIDLYHRLLPWIPSHPSRALHDGVERGCPGCGGTELIRHGYAYTRQGKYQRFECKGCGKWSRGTKRVEGSDLVEVTA